VRYAQGFLQTSQELHDAFLVTADAASVALSSPEQKQYTATLFLLAQVYQHTQQADKSARCCLQTLDRQALSLTPDELCFQANEWVSNAIQVCGQRPVSVPVMAPVAAAVLERMVLYQHPRLWGIMTGTMNLLNRPRGGKTHGAEAVALPPKQSRTRARGKLTGFSPGAVALAPIGGSRQSGYLFVRRNNLQKNLDAEFKELALNKT